MSTYVTMGVDRQGYVYGLELTETAEDFRRNSLGFSTSCVTIRPVDQKTLEDYRENPDTVKDLWKADVASDNTEDGLEDWFESILADNAGTVFDNDDEGYPFKDESWCHALLLDMENPTVKTYELVDHGLRKHIEDAIRDNDEVNIPGVDKYDIATWESAGWWPPKEPFVIPLADPDLLEAYYKHLEETYEEFKR